MRSAELRSAFLNFFQQKDHFIAPSASVIPHHDDSLLFTTAGMVPFKDIFLGKKKPDHPTLASSQKCIRAGGKHNDLEQVGHTPRHHTFFEMLGNFSFGDYFREQAIVYAWEFLTQILKLSPERLWVSVYHTDEDAFALWQKILPESRIVRIHTQDNFWSMGDVGPCGRCSEIFYDHGSQVSGGPPGSAEADGARFVEIWNLVFIEFEQLASKQYIPLSSLSIDTGMGLERLAAVLQGVHNNFETDILRALVRHSQDLTSHLQQNTAHYVIADHLRSSSFLIADGVMPSNEGRGYVLRRIIRRALRHVHHLKAFPDHLAKLVPSLISEMGSHYTELLPAQPLIESILTQEGEKFQDLLNNGMALLNQWLSWGNHPVFPGHKAFQLYDTYGFPLDLTQDILKEHHISVDEKEFYHCMQQQREQSRKSWVGSGEAVKSYAWAHNAIPSSQFMGYEKTKTVGNVQMLLSHESKIHTLIHGQSGELIADITPFYGAGGGQISDTGWIIGPHGKMEVSEVFQHEKWIVHKGIVREGHLSKGDAIELVIDASRRKAIRANHSATHLLQAALRSVLGPHVVQKGSLVSDTKLRFDFSHYHAMTPQQLDEVEKIVNTSIRENIAVTDCLMNRKEALEAGAMALFGEKYSDRVRVVTMGQASQELCAGTHVSRTGDIGFFKIIGESSIASGVRRIEAVTGEIALLFVQSLHEKIKSLANILKVTPDTLEKKVQSLLEKSPPAVVNIPLSVKKEKLKDINFWHGYYPEANAKNLKHVMDDLKKKISSGMIALSSDNVRDNKATVIFGITSDLAPQWSAAHLLSMALSGMGSGGGSVYLAQGGGSLENLNHEVFVTRIKDAFQQEFS